MTENTTPEVPETAETVEVVESAATKTTAAAKKTAKKAAKKTTATAKKTAKKTASTTSTTAKKAAKKTAATAKTTAKKTTAKVAPAEGAKLLEVPVVRVRVTLPALPEPAEVRSRVEGQILVASKAVEDVVTPLITKAQEKAAPARTDRTPSAPVNALGQPANDSGVDTVKMTAYLDGAGTFRNKPQNGSSNNSIGANGGGAGLPSLPVPTGSVVRSFSTVPAMA